jgi:perosamine synthetase
MDDLARLIRDVCHQGDGPIQLHAPEVAGNEWAYIKECLDTEWVSTVGSYVDRFEAMLAEITGAKYAIAVNTGTAALHVSLMLAGVKAGDEVITPSLSFIATANATAYIGAIPHFADIEETSLGLDPAKLDAHLAEIGERKGGQLVNRHTGRIIRAVCCMHTFGHPVDLDPLMAVCDRYGLVLVEDAAESLGSFYKGRHTGNFGRLASLSFNGNKVVTTGGGGAILTNDEALAKRARHLTTTAKAPHRFRFDHDAVGFNYRLPNINAAMGCAQLERLDDFIARKRLLHDRYVAAFKDVEGIRIFTEAAYAKSNYWLNVALLDKPDRPRLEGLLDDLNAQGLQCRPAWTPMHRLVIYAHCQSMDLSVTEDVNDRLINIPSSPRLAAS